MKPAAEQIMRLALRLASRGYGLTSPNPVVGAVLVKSGKIIGRGWHHRAGEPHAEVEAIRDATRRGHRTKGATLYVTLEPCSSQGRTPPCTKAIAAAGIRQVVVGATDPNPIHRGKAFVFLKRAGIEVRTGLLAEECAKPNEAFNHWIVHRTPLVVVKAAMSVDGRVASKSGDSKWITGDRARAYGMQLRLGADAILVGINTVLTDDPSLTYRGRKKGTGGQKRLRRIVLDALARTPIRAKVVTDGQADLTTIVVSKFAPRARVTALAKRVKVIVAPVRAMRSPRGRMVTSLKCDLGWLLKRLGSEGVTRLLVEGGGEVNASFLLERHAHQVAFFYAPKVIGGRNAPRSVAGNGVARVRDGLRLTEVEWRRLGTDFLLTARVTNSLTH
jgi:diaminohydroxyphosphoribosylaminopyrimidine deaminase/5-amino-6-(5-phosphoribosylamino)uracil reductase